MERKNKHKQIGWQGPSDHDNRMCIMVPVKVQNDIEEVKFLLMTELAISSPVTFVIKHQEAFRLQFLNVISLFSKKLCWLSTIYTIDV